MEIKLHLSGYDIVYNGITIYFGIMPKATDEEKNKVSHRYRALEQIEELL